MRKNVVATPEPASWSPVGDLKTSTFALLFIPFRGSNRDEQTVWDPLWVVNVQSLMTNLF